MSLTTTANRFPNTTSATVSDPAAKKSSVTSTKKAATKRKTKPKLIRLAQSRGPRYDVMVEFSDDKGKSYSSSKLKVVGGKVYYVKAKFTQHQATPLLQGVKLRWVVPTGWKWQDGWGAYTDETCISNPLEIMRVIKAPGSPAKSFVKVLVPKVFG